MKIQLLWGALALGAVLCAQVKFSGKIRLSGKMSVVATSTTPSTTINCTNTSTPCVAMNLFGTDPYAPNLHFAGDADPTARTDPQSGTQWLCYSWANAVSGANAIQSHCQSSTDGGHTWTFQGVLFPSITTVISGVTYHSSAEVVNILPVWDGVSGHATKWIGIYDSYYTANGGADLNASHRFPIAVCSGTALGGPLCLTSATPQYLGTNVNTDAVNFPIDLNVQAMDPALNVCSVIREPALHVDSGAGSSGSGNLLLFMNCGSLQFIFQLQAPLPTVSPWVWSYIAGSNGFATHTDALSVCAFTNSCAAPNHELFEFDIAFNHAGTGLEGVVSSGYLTPTRISTGVLAVRIDCSALPCDFVRDGGGNIIVDNTLLSKDSVARGPGGSTYDPQSFAGIIMSHDQTNCTAGDPGCSTTPGFVGRFTYLMQSLLQP